MRTEGGDIIVGDRVWSIRWSEKYLRESETTDGYVMEGTLFDLVSDSRKPSMVYFYSSSMSPNKRSALEKKMFNQAAVIIASRFFYCVRIDVDEIEDPKARARYAPRVPSFHFYTSAGEIVGKKHGTMSPKGLVQAMHDTYHSEYDMCVSPRLHAVAHNIRSQTSLGLNLIQAKADLAENLSKAEKRGTAARMKKVRKARQQINVLDLRLAELRDKEKILMLPPAKREKKDS